MKNLILIPLVVLSLIGCDQQSKTFGDNQNPPVPATDSPPVLSLLGELADPNFVPKIEFGATYQDSGVQAIDDEDGDISASIFLDLSQVNFSALGIYPVTYSITDSDGNTTTATRNIEIVDTTAPSLTLVGSANETVEFFSLLYLDPGATSVDNFDGVLTGSIQTTGSVNTNVLGPYTITYSVQDSSGNSTNISRTVTVVDTTAPAISLIGPPILSLEVNDPYFESGAVATDVGYGDISSNIVISGSVNTAVSGLYTLTYTITDPNGNSSSVQRVITVGDTTPPAITVLGNNPETVSANSSYVDAGATALDAVDGNLTSSIQTTGSVNTNVLGVYTITYTVQDAAGNSSSATRTVNVIDTTSPAITITGNNPLEVSHASSYTELGATASDNIDGDLTSSIQTTGSVDPNTVGVYTITYTVQDAAGNSSSATRTVNVVDNTDPVITITGDNPLEISHGSSYTELGATALDAVDGDLTSSIQTTGSVDPNTVGSYTITYTVQDTAGNSASETRTVNVVDNTPPVITILGDNPLDISPGSTFTDPGTTALDAVDGDLTSSIQVSGTVDTNTLGIYTITYTVQDAAGNSASETRTVNVVDATPPVITVLGNNPETVIQGNSYTEAGATALDDVDGDLTSSIQTTGSVDTLTVGTYTITYTVQDAAGNSASETRTVNVDPDPNLLNKSIFYSDGFDIHRINILDPLDNEVFIDNADYSFSAATSPYYFEDNLYFAGRVGSRTRVFKYDLQNDTVTELFNTHTISSFHPKVLNGTHLVFPVSETSGSLEDVAIIDSTGNLTIHQLDKNIYIGEFDFFTFNGLAYFGGLATDFNTYSIDVSGNVNTIAGFSVRKGKAFENQNFALIHGRDTSFDFNLYKLDTSGTFTILIASGSTSRFPHFGISDPNYAVFSDGNTIFTVDNAGVLTNITDVFSITDLLEDAVILNDKIYVSYDDLSNGVEVSTFVLAPGPTQGDFAQVQNFNPTGDNDFKFFNESIQDGGIFVGVADDGSSTGKALYEFDELTGTFTSNIVYDPLGPATAQTFEMEEIFYRDGLSFFYSIQEDGTYTIFSIDSSLSMTLMDELISNFEGFTYYPGPF